MKTGNARWIAFAVVAVALVGALACQNKAKPSTVPETPRAEAEPPKPPPEPPPAAEPFPKTDVDKTAVVEPSIDELNRQGVLQTVYFAFNSNELDQATTTFPTSSDCPS